MPSFILIDSLSRSHSLSGSHMAMRIPNYLELFFGALLVPLAGVGTLLVGTTLAGLSEQDKHEWVRIFAVLTNMSGYFVIVFGLEWLYTRPLVVTASITCLRHLMGGGGWFRVYLVRLVTLCGNLLFTRVILWPRLFLPYS